MSGGRAKRAWGSLLVTLAVLVGGALVVDQAVRTSATYDEVTYLKVASEWWRTGKRDRIARMGSPLTFWKLQHAPVFWALDRGGFGRLIEAPEEHQEVLVPLVRVGSLWIWAIALVVTAGWAGAEHGPGARMGAAWVFALSPNLLAHGALATMELPLVACAAGMLWAWGRYVAIEAGDGSTGFCRVWGRQEARRESGSSPWLEGFAPFELRAHARGHGGAGVGWLLGAGVLGGVAFSCKFTAILLPPALVGGWAVLEWRRGRGAWSTLRGAVGRLAALLVVMGTTNVIVTGGATLPLSERSGAHPALVARLGPELGGRLGALLETPVPQDWVGFARQMEHQRTGGPGYLLGRVSRRGWWYYYLVGLLVKMPLGVAVGLALRWTVFRRAPRVTGGEAVGLFLVGFVVVVTALGSSRNYGFRYLLVLAPAAIVGLSALAEGGVWGRLLLAVVVAGQAVATARVHPAELAYFNLVAGGPEGGRAWLADSNLDWGQGAKGLARLQREHSEFRDLTTYTFGNTDPAHYGVVGPTHVIDADGPRGELPDPRGATTRYVAVSRSLSDGPWGPAGVFATYRGRQPVAVTEDHAIAIYEQRPASDSPAGAGR